MAAHGRRPGSVTGQSAATRTAARQSAEPASSPFRTGVIVAILTLSDEMGLLNAVVRPLVYARDRATIRGEALLWIGGVVERRDGAVTLRVVWARPLAVALSGEAHG